MQAPAPENKTAVQRSQEKGNWYQSKINATHAESVNFFNGHYPTPLKVF